MGVATISLNLYYHDFFIFTKIFIAFDYKDRKFFNLIANFMSLTVIQCVTAGVFSTTRFKQSLLKISLVIN